MILGSWWFPIFWHSRATQTSTRSAFYLLFLVLARSSTGGSSLRGRRTTRCSLVRTFDGIQPPGVLRVAVWCSPHCSSLVPKLNVSSRRLDAPPSNSRIHLRTIIYCNFWCYGVIHVSSHVSPLKPSLPEVFRTL